MHLRLQQEAPSSGKINQVLKLSDEKISIGRTQPLRALLNLLQHLLRRGERLPLLTDHSLWSGASVTQGRRPSCEIKVVITNDLSTHFGRRKFRARWQRQLGVQ